MTRADRDDDELRGDEPGRPHPSRMRKVTAAMAGGLVRAVVGQMITLLLHQWWSD